MYEQECKNGRFDAFQFTENELKICDDFDILYTTPLKSLPGYVLESMEWMCRSCTVIHKRVFEPLGTEVVLGEDFECSGLPTSKNSESMQKLLQQVSVRPECVSMNGDQNGDVWNHSYHSGV